MPRPKLEDFERMRGMTPLDCKLYTGKRDPAQYWGDLCRGCDNGLECTKFVTETLDDKEMYCYACGATLEFRALVYMAALKEKIGTGVGMLCCDCYAECDGNVGEYAEQVELEPAAYDAIIVDSQKCKVTCRLYDPLAPNSNKSKSLCIPCRRFNACWDLVLSLMPEGTRTCYSCGQNVSLPVLVKIARLKQETGLELRAFCDFCMFSRMSAGKTNVDAIAISIDEQTSKNEEEIGNRR